MLATLETKRQRNTSSQGLTSELKERADKYVFWTQTESLPHLEKQIYNCAKNT